MLDPVAARQSDAERLLAIREAAARWLSSNRIRQWETGEVGVEQIRTQIGAGECFAHRPDGKIQGELRLLWSDPEIWVDRPDDAAYVHGLVIDRRHVGAGLGLGGRLLEWAEQQALGAGRAFLRLDCVETNVRLRRYYCEQGFREVGRRDLGEGWWPAMLFEKPI